MEQHTRFQLTDAPAASPGVDFITRTPTGPFVDTGYNVTFEDGRFSARVYLSVDTIRELAETAGLFAPQRDADTEELAASYKAVWDDGYKVALKENADVLRDLVGRLGAAVGGLGDPGMDGFPVQPDSVESAEAESAELDSDESSGDREDEAPKRPTRQGTRTRRVGRPAGISSDTGDGPQFQL